MMALLALPVAREITPEVSAMEGELAVPLVMLGAWRIIHGVKRRIGGHNT